MKPPWANRWLLLGVTLPVLLHLSVLYTPSLATIFQLAPLSSEDWRSVMMFSLPLVLLEEGLNLFSGGHLPNFSFSGVRARARFCARALHPRPAPAPGVLWAQHAPVQSLEHSK